MTDTNTSSDAAPDVGGGADEFFSDLGAAFNDQVDSIELGEDGSLDMRIHSAEPDVSEDADSESAVTPDAVTPAGDPPAPQADPYESRFKEVQGWATRVAQENAALNQRLAALEGSQPATQETEEENPLDPEFASQLESYLERNLDKLLVSKGIDPAQVQEMSSDFGINKELRTAMAAHDDFVEYWPVISEIFQQMPDSNMSYEQAYELATTMYAIEPADSDGEVENVEAPQTPNPNGTPGQAAPSQQTPSRADLERRAREVSTLTSYNTEGNVTPERVIKTPLDAAQAALDDMGELTS